MSIGTITSESSILVRWMAGGTLGTIEESFIARIKPGDRFVFAGQTLELVRYREMTAYVRKSTRTSGVVPRWDGGRFPLSSQLAAAVRRQFHLARRGIYRTAEMGGSVCCSSSTTYCSIPIGIIPARAVGGAGRLPTPMPC